MKQSLLDCVLESLFERALATPHGLAVPSDDVDILRRRCYVVKNAHGNRFNQLQFSISPEHEKELWIIKRSDRPARPERSTDFNLAISKDLAEGEGDEDVDGEETS